MPELNWMLAAAIAAVCLVLAAAFTTAFGVVLARAFRDERRIDPASFACTCGDPLHTGWADHLGSITWSPGIEHRPVLAHPVDRLIREATR